MAGQRVRTNVFVTGPFVLSGSLLNEALDISETGINVDDGTDFQIGDVIRVEAEEMLVTNIATNTLTVDTRPYNDTTAATHADDTPVYVRPFEKITVSTTAIGPTAGRIPEGVVESEYTLEGGNVRYRCATAKPTATVGNLLIAPCTFKVTGARDIRTILFIATGGDGTLTVEHKVEA